jgi:uncharacterized protein YoxC
MIDKRITLTRILAINWYGFRQILDVSGHTLIAGAFGTGKTALLDLIQYVLLGRFWKPNRAAAGNNQSRSIVSYCLCDTNTLRNGEPHYTRSSGVTIIGLEFTWPLEAGQTEPRRETWGVRIEYSSPTAEPRPTYFYVPERVEWNTLAPEGALLDEEAFRTWVRREFDKENLFSRQQDFLAEMATPNHLYFEADQFRKTLPKAIAFEPEENVERFIRDFILEENPIDVRDVRTAVSAYRDTQDRLLNQEDEATQLRKVCEADTLHQSLQKKAGIFQHVSRAVLHAQAVDKHSDLTIRLEILRRENAEDLTGAETKTAKLNEIKAIIDATRLEISADHDAVQLEKLQTERKTLHAEIQRIEEAKKSARERLMTIRQRWTSWLRGGRDFATRDVLAADLANSLTVDESLLEALAGPLEAPAFSALAALAGTFNDLWQSGAQTKRTIDDATRRSTEKLQQLVADLEALDRREMPGSFPVYRAIHEATGGRAHQLARLIEVKPEAERWWTALELFLGRQRWVIVVSKDDYRLALDVLRRTAPGREGESLLNPHETEGLRHDAKPNSLATKVDVTLPLAETYVRHLLGDVLCVETVEEMDASPAGRAITPDGIFKQVPLRRRLNSGREVTLTLGTEGLKRIRASKEQEQITTRKEKDRLQLLADDLNAWLDQGKKAGLGESSLPYRPEEIAELPKKWGDWRSLGETIELLRTPEREKRLELLQNHEAEHGKLQREIGVIESRMQGFRREEDRALQSLNASHEEVLTHQRELEQIHATLPANVTASDLQTSLQEILAQDSQWPTRLAKAQERTTDAQVKANQALNERNNARRHLISSEKHPEYRHDFDEAERDNNRWAARLRQLDDVELPKFRELAGERRKDWEARLRDNVLDRLQERLNKAMDDIRLLRDYLSHDVGRHRYTITQRRDPAFQSIWQLIDTGFEPTDELLRASHSEDVQTALEELMKAIESSGELDDRARKLLDYRCYHRYDIEMVPKDDTSAPVISLSRSLRSLSGGENQAPFFISMLAAFRRVYDIGSHRSHHLGLVVMDEAFSKLSGDGVEDCLELARNFQLQLVLAFPIERLGVMAPYAENVIICRKEEHRDDQGFITRVDNIPQRLSMSQAMEALE